MNFSKQTITLNEENFRVTPKIVIGTTYDANLFIIVETNERGRNSTVRLNPRLAVKVRDKLNQAIRAWEK
jgi:hypothetical protein